MSSTKEKKPAHHPAASWHNSDGNTLFPQDGKKNILGSNFVKFFKFLKVLTSKLFRANFFKNHKLLLTQWRKVIYQPRGQALQLLTQGFCLLGAKGWRWKH